MATVAITSEQQGRLQAEVQRELEKREWAEPNDNVMAEYITVLLANGSTKERVKTEMDDLVGSDFDPQFLEWLFDTALGIQRSAAPAAAPAAAPQTSEPGPSSTSPSQGRHGAYAGPTGGSRMFSGALADSQKRKAENDDGPRKRGGDNGPPSGPRAIPGEGRSLADRLGGRSRGPMQVRGQGNARGGMNGMGFGGNGSRGGNCQGGFPPQGMMGPGFGPGFFPPGQQEMMAQMMMMQANMAQMGEMMARMAEEKAASSAAPAPTAAGARPPKPPPKIPHGTKLGGHSVSGIQPKSSANPGPIPDKPSSKALCRYSVGCSNSRCPFSHPSPVADEKTGMVLSDEACEQGKNCKDAECIKSHVSPAAALGEGAGPSRLLCKYQNCTNPACPFRHEDAEGNPIPPPALTAAKAAKEKAKLAATAAASRDHMQASSDNEDGDGDMEVVMTHKGLMDGALDDSKAERACRYGERCTRPDCKFSHPASRPTPKARGSHISPFNRPALTGNGFGSGGAGGMNKSKKFGAAASTTGKSLDPSAGAFTPGGAAPAADKDLDVTM